MTGRRPSHGAHTVTVFATMSVLLLTACFSLGHRQRRARIETVLSQPQVLVVVDPRAKLAFVTAARALRLSTGFEDGEKLRAEFDLPSPTAGFAEAFATALGEKPRLASSRLQVVDIGDASAALREQGDSQVLFAHTGEWRLYHDLSLGHYAMKVWLNVQVVPARQVADGQGPLALPDRLWKWNCTYRGPDRAQPMEAWRADRGALLHQVLAEAQRQCGRKAADLLVEFLEGGQPQGAFDFGDLPKEPVPPAPR